MATIGHGSFSRRQLLASIATAAFAIAGCLGDDGDDATPTPSPTPGPVLPDRETIRTYEATARTFTGALIAHDFEAAAEAVDPSVQAQLSAAELEQAWTGVEAERGGARAIFQSRYHDDSDDGAIIVVGVSHTDGPQEVVVSVSSDQTILGVLLPELPAWSPPGYVDEAAFTTETVDVETPIGCDLGGTVCVPAADGPVPGVLIVHGSGPADRDGTVGPNRTYRELAEGLASRGLATLRYDKRSYACDVDLADVTVHELVIDDALAALEVLAATDGVDADRLVVAGHSLGGLLAPRIADLADGVAGVAMLAAPMRSMDELVLDQREHLVAADDRLSDATAAAHLALAEEQARRIRELDIGDDEVINYHGGREYYASLAAYDRVETATGLAVPLALFQGELDWQVTPEDDFEPWLDALEAADVAHESYRYEGLNHRFQASDGSMLPDEYAQPDRPVAEAVIDDLAEVVLGFDPIG